MSDRCSREGCNRPLHFNDPGDVCRDCQWKDKDAEDRQRAIETGSYWLWPDLEAEAALDAMHDPVEETETGIFYPDGSLLRRTPPEGG